MKFYISILILLLSIFLNAQDAITDDLQEPILRTINSPANWIFYLFLFQFILIAVVKNIAGTELYENLRSFINLKIANQVFRERENNLLVSNLILSINFILSLSITTFLLVKDLKVFRDLEQWYIFFVAIPFTLIIVGAKYLLLLLSKLIMPLKQQFEFYNFNFTNSNLLLGIALIPLNLLLYYNANLVGKISLLLILSVMTIKLLHDFSKGFLITRTYFSTYKLHYILYICALEFAPVLILGKLLWDGISTSQM